MKVEDFKELAKRIKLKTSLEELEIEELKKSLTEFAKVAKLEGDSNSKRIIDESLDLDELKEISKNYQSNPVDEKILRHNALVSDDNLIVINK
jgi:hypothetical protein